MADMARGKVTRIYPHDTAVFLRLDGLTPALTPRDGYFRIDKNHPNYASLYSIAVVAAVNRYVISVRAAADITNLQYAEVRDILLDYVGQYGALDTSFGGTSSGTGIVMTDVSGANDRGTAMAVQPDGSIYVAGSTGEPRPRYSLARYRPDGTLDPSFGNAGIASYSLLLQNLFVADIALQPDGMVLVAGSVNLLDLWDLTAVRFLPDGTLDSNFNGGSASFRFGQLPTMGSAVALQPDGKIVLAGSAVEHSFNEDRHYVGLVRLNPDGTEDSTFGVNGITAARFYQAQGYSILSVEGIALQLDGKIVMAGSFTVEGAWRIFLVRFTADGQLDPSFGEDGIIETTIASEAQAEDITIQPGSGGPSAEGILVAGTTGSGTTQDFLLLRYNPDGSLDSTFGSGGSVITDFDSRQDQAKALTVAEDGSIFAAGFSKDGTTSDLAVAHYHASGTPDLSFGTDGKVRTSLPNAGGAALDAAVISGGHATSVPLRPIWLAVAGYASNGINNDFLLARYEAGLSVAKGQWLEPVLGMMLS
jgi:uncharacterized delta-60 repeat protein